jgi:tRNA A37 threonylcarbamoyladenosine modification protein TsaB
MDARRNQLYNALFLCEGERITRLCDDRLIDARELEGELSSLVHPIYFVGEGCRVTERVIDLPHAHEIAPSMRYQSGYSVAAVASKIYEEAEDKAIFTDLALQPTYLRASQAERERNGEK